VTARIRIPEGRRLIELIDEQKDTVYGVPEHHIGKTWAVIHRNPAKVRVAGARAGVTA